MTQTDVRPDTTTTTSAPATAAANGAGRTLAIVAFVLAGIALFILPPVFGIAGIVCAAISMGKGDPLGKWALLASIVGLVGGMVLGYIVLTS